jgi:cell surface protein SprA
LFTDPFIEKNSKKDYYGQITWNYAPQAKEFTPFKKLIKSKSKWLDIIRDFNINLLPATLSFNTDMSRQFGVIQAPCIRRQ